MSLREMSRGELRESVEKIIESRSSQEFAGKESEEVTLEKPRDHGRPVHTKLDEAVVPSQIEETESEKLKRLETAERKLTRAFSDDPEPLYRAEGLVVEKSDVPFWRLLDLTESLTDLEMCKTRLPQRYETDTNKVLKSADLVKHIFHEYYSWAETQHDAPLRIKEGLILPLLQLRRIDPHVFPRDLVELTDEEFGFLGLPEFRLVYDRLLREARLAEYDPERFRRIFGKDYPAERIARERAFWVGWDEDNQDSPSQPRCLPAWETIERALQQTEKT